MTEQPNDLFVVDSTLPSEAKIHCDGASSGNPGHAGIGVVVQRKLVHPGLVPALRGGQVTVHRVSEYIGIATNNIAEYTAFIRGLETAKLLGLKRIEVFLDSELLVRQIIGVYRVKNPNLRLLWVKAQNILKKFDYYKVTHVKRELNKEADLLAKKAVRDFLKDLLPHVKIYTK
jgi:ribonuclease HI